ncbi:MAG: rod shape-determining protein MreC [Bacillota bacterium]|nr:rod shape-determining protein MreC [Bacillota bacterium]
MNERYKKVIITVVGIILILLMVISFGGRDRITVIESQLGSIFIPVQRFLTNIGNYIDEKTEPIINVLNYKELNEDLTKENEFLKEQIVGLTMSQKELNELKQLKSALKYVDNSQLDSIVSANVIAKDIGNWYNMFTIDVGYDQGITKNSTVVNGNGLVGLVYEVGEKWSKVIAIIDHKSSVGFEMMRVSDDYVGTLSGTTNYELIGELFDPKANVVVDEYIVTSGLGMYPKGILVGQIYEVIEDRDQLLKRIKVMPVVDFKKIDKIMVIPYLEDEKSNASEIMNHEIQLDGE